MHSLIFLLAGLIFVAVAFIGKKTRKKFIAESFNVPGVVVDIKKERQRSGNSTAEFSLPIIEYRVDASFRFKAEIDANKHHIKLGDSVEVQVDRSNHRIAKLKKGNKEFNLVMNLMLFLGLTGCGVSVYLFNPADFHLDLNGNLFPLLFIATAIPLFSVRIYPMVRLCLDQGPSYSENAYPVSENPGQD